jgi:putative ABC transport system substrate-binding protein
VRDLIPSAALIAILVDPNNPTAAGITMDVQTAAKLFEVQTYIVKARSDQEMDDAFAALTQRRAGALLVMADPFFDEGRQQLISLAKHYAVPTIYDRRDFPIDGGLMSYGVSAVDRYRRSGRYIGRILNGAKPADLPILQSTKFELVINLKTAKALGLAVPQSLLATADEVIE